MMMMSARMSWIGGLVGLLAGLLAGCTSGIDLPPAVEMAYQQLPDELAYNFQVKPILSDKCFACHGPDEANRQADLRLDTRAGALAPLESGNGRAVIAGRPGKSALVQRILSQDPEMLMPTPDSHLSLSDQEKATLIKWIENGAEYQDHWSFLPVQQPDLPTVKDRDKAAHEIDHFVLAKLENQDLTFSPRAEKEQLIRRASFDLRGLPPSLEEIAAFVEDESENAYEHLLDRYLASPAYGERMAANWMDVARYADSDGYLDDKHRDFSPYRDWVIQAFNENMPYEQFVTWQLAGDLIPDRSQASILATAFNRLHKRNSEAGIVYEEFRTEYVADRTNTLGKAFLGLSTECARCHDHKYDPISQKEYFQLFAFFNSTDELGTAVYGPDQTPGPALLLMEDSTRAHLDSIRAYLSRLETEQAHTLQQAEPTSETLPSQAMIQERLDRKLLAHYDFEQLFSAKKKGYESREFRRKAGPITYGKEPTIEENGYKGKAFFVKEYQTATGPKGLGWFDRTDPFSIQFAIYPDTLYEEAYFLWHCEERRLGLKGYSFALDSNRLRFYMAHSWPQNAIDLTTEIALPVRTWTHVTMTYDGSSKAAGVKLYLNGEKVAVSVARDHLYKSILFEPNIHTYGFHNLRFGYQGREKVMTHSGLDELKVYQGSLSPLEVAVSLGQPIDHVSPIPEDVLQEEPDYIAQQARLHQARQDENLLVSQVPEIMVMGDLPEARPTYLLNRGAYDQPGEEVFPGTPERVLAFDEALPQNRLGLAQWLFDPENPLTARVYVNRMWMMHFGRGIVETAEDFGSQGSLPSHPELLDWLAHDFMTHGWDIKRLHKQIMLSATYQQSSVIQPEDLERDPENVWLARGASFRLPAEMIRDNALAISGLLETEVGGPAAYPYQPKGLWGALTTKHWAYRYPHDQRENIYRRSLYTVWKRQAPPPAMQIFDLANRDACTVRRTVTNTPLQALTLLNDPQFVEASRKLAERVMLVQAEPSRQLEQVFHLCTSRSPDEEELALLEGFYEQEKQRFDQDPAKATAYLSMGQSGVHASLSPVEVAALAVVSNAILNTDEALNRR